MTRDELDATVVERAKRRYPETLSGEERAALARAAQALRVKGLLVEALEAVEWSGVDHRQPYSPEGYCPACDCPQSGGVHDEECDIGRALAEARKTP